MHTKLKKKAVLDRISTLEKEIAIAREYLKSGDYANWHKFRPLFVDKLKDGKPEPPHRDWVANVFIPSREKELRRSEKIVEKLENGD